MKIDQGTIIKIVSMGGVALSLVGTLLSGRASSMEQEKKIAEEVAKAIANQKKQQGLNDSAILFFSSKEKEKRKKYACLDCVF